MQGIGEKLRAAREAKKLSIRDVVEDTNISQPYIDALEEEEFDKFPSETYLIGFLRSYSEYLKLDTEEMIQAYKGYKIGESATPLEELTKPTNSNITVNIMQFYANYKNVVFAGVAVAAAFFLIWGIKTVVSSSIDLTGAPSISQIKEEYNLEGPGDDIKGVRSLQFQDNQGYVLVYRNEAVQFLVDKKEVVFILRDIIDRNAVEIEILPERNIVTLAIEQPRTFEVDGAYRDMTFNLRGMTENRARVEVVLGTKDEEAEIAEREDKTPTGDFTTVEAMSRENLKIVFEAEFVDRSYMEVYLDGTLSSRSFMREGTRERWEASENIQVKIGNAGGVKAAINGRDYTFGGPGQVANKVITWEKDINNPNIYHIVVRDW